MSPLKINQSFEKRGLANLSSPELAMYSPKDSKTVPRQTARSAPPLADKSPKFAQSVDCKLTVPSVAVAPLYSHRNVTSTPGYPSGNIAVNITTANRGKHGRNRNLKQPQHTTAQYFPYTIKSVQPPPVASTLKPLAKTLTTPPREDVLRLCPIGTTVVTKSSSRTLSGQV